VRRWLLPLILLAEIALFTALSGQSFTSTADAASYFRSYFADLVCQSAPVLLIAFGMTIVLMTAGIDLSVGSMVALVACVMASFPAGPEFWWTAVPLGLALALLLGATNGALIAWLDVPPIITTLGTMILYRGLCFVVMGDLEKSPFLSVPGYEWLGQVSGAALLLVLTFGLAGFWLKRSRWLRRS
jgi:ribose/xylose/arabinose/galactoside ABC-type transport system permease subunit